MKAMADLFDDPDIHGSGRAELAEGAVVLRGFAIAEADALLAAVAQVVADAPWRHLVTPGGFRMSVAMTNCGRLGWVSDRRGYRYSANDPESGRAWPAMPPVFASIAEAAAREAGFPGYAPDACLINRYAPGTRLSLHQDRDERRVEQPIVTVSLGLPARFQFGGLERSDRPQVLLVRHGDVTVWGGASRMRYHGVLPLQAGTHPATGDCRISLNFRRAV